MSPLLQALLKQAELTPEEQLELISRLADQLRIQTTSPKPQRRWSEPKGMAPYPLMGEDAQEWVSRTRREGDERW